MFSLLHGSEGHPVHPPLTDAAIGAYVVATVFSVVGAIGWIEDAAGKTAWLALLVGLGAGSAAAVTGLADLLTIPRPSPTFRTAAFHGSVMATATVLFLLAAVFQYDGFHDGTVTTAGLVFAVIGFLVLMVGGWLGGSVVFEHGMRVSDAAQTYARSSESMQTSQEPRRVA
jgi:uncharacterized membrane protein